MSLIFLNFAGAMSPKTVSYIKVFSLFLLITAVITSIIFFVKQYLRHRDIISSDMDFIFTGILTFGYMSAWRWLRLRLKEIERN